MNDPEPKNRTFIFTSESFPMRIIFMGTPAFAVPSLQILLENHYNIVAVITAPDKPGGRQGIQQSAVKQFAVEKGLKVLQPEKFKNPDFLADLAALKADLQIVVAFRMLPELVWNMPPLGTMNLHGSLLPKYRGAAPINWAVINGETETGVTTFLLKHEIDTGDLIFQEKIPIGPDETAGELHDRMMQIGAKLILKSVQALENGTASPLPQADVEATHAPKIFVETCKIQFDQPAVQVHNFIRGLSPYPGAWTKLEGKTLKILRSKLVPEEQWKPEIGANLSPGNLFSDGKNYLYCSTSDGFISVLELQLEGKKRMLIRDFLNGYAGGLFINR
jgi:methionyl-tRNA formyltransferase